MLTSDDHTSPTQVEEWVIMSDIRKHPTTLDNASIVYAKDTSSSIRFLIAEKEQMAKELQTARKGGQLDTASA